jgi:hypothetical protein
MTGFFPSNTPKSGRWPWGRTLHFAASAKHSTSSLVVSIGEPYKMLARANKHFFCAHYSGMCNSS